MCLSTHKLWDCKYTKHVHFSHTNELTNYATQRSLLHMVSPVFRAYIKLATLFSLLVSYKSAVHIGTSFHYSYYNGNEKGL